MTRARRIRIAPEIIRDFPGVLVGVVVARDVNNRGTRPELEDELRQAGRSALQALGSTPPAQHPWIVPWREAYRSFGAKPKKYPSSIENLLQRTASSGPPRSINPLVDLYNVVSLLHLLPAGGEDLDKIEGDLVLRYARQEDPPALLLGESEPRQAATGEVIYADTLGPVCRRWNWKEADRTKLSEATTSAILVIEALPPVTRSRMQSALSQVESLVNRFCQGRTRVCILDSDCMEMELEG